MKEKKKKKGNMQEITWRWGINSIFEWIWYCWQLPDVAADTPHAKFGWTQVLQPGLGGFPQPLPLGGYDACWAPRTGLTGSCNWATGQPFSLNLQSGDRGEKRRSFGQLYSGTSAQFRVKEVWMRLQSLELEQRQGGEEKPAPLSGSSELPSLPATHLAARWELNPS